MRNHNWNWQEEDAFYEEEKKERRRQKPQAKEIADACSECGKKREIKNLELGLCRKCEERRFERKQSPKT